MLEEMGLLKLFERFVVAVEAIAAALARQEITGSSGIEDAQFTDKGVSTTEKEELVKQRLGNVEVKLPPDTSVGAQAGADSAKIRREFLKKELQAKGVKFTASAKTETLEKLYAEATKTPAAPANPFETELPPGPNGPADPFETGAAPAQETFTKDQVKAYLIALSNLKGQAEALHVLNTIGGATTVTELAAERYVTVVNACQVRGVKL